MISSTSTANRFTFNPSLISTQLYQPSSINHSVQPVYVNENKKQNYQSLVNQQQVYKPLVNQSSNIKFG